jgi:K(+)-stimulated pyrophosphate-energized sodium pump
MSGGDMVGKVEAGIPEDDPRNPATIADNVGRQCRRLRRHGRPTCSRPFAVTTVATMVLASIYFSGDFKSQLMIYPLAIAGLSIVTSIIGTSSCGWALPRTSWGALYKGVIAYGHPVADRAVAADQPA